VLFTNTPEASFPYITPVKIAPSVVVPAVSDASPLGETNPEYVSISLLSKLTYSPIKLF
jgi:hypothetical protein